MHTTSNKTDEALMARLAAGDLDAATALFRRHNVGLFNFFLRMGHARDVGEDLVQTVFERIIKYRQSFRGELAFRAWMYQIARNVQADYYRQRPRFVPDDFTLLEDLGDLSEPPVSQGLERENQLVQLEKSLERLPDDQREILLLTRYQRLKYIEVGAILGCSEGAVKQKVLRALQQLRIIFFKLEQSE